MLPFNPSLQVRLLKPDPTFRNNYLIFYSFLYVGDTVDNLYMYIVSDKYVGVMCFCTSLSSGYLILFLNV